ncbi:MAG: hypothetical protein MAG453_00363 [Calditrichaeota bacterium]|nr:hypothetical protein [Calditrichota bacterium]
MPIHFASSSYTAPRRDALRGEHSGSLPLNATITRRHDLHEALAVLTISLNGWRLEPFEPGQYIDVSLQVRSNVQQEISLSSAQWSPSDLIRRSYSIASSPDRLGEIELLLNLVPRGQFTPVLWRLDEGARVLRPHDTHIYLCGNPEMIRDLSTRFAADGFTPHTPNRPGNLHVESYWTSSH